MKKWIVAIISIFSMCLVFSSTLSENEASAVGTTVKIKKYKDNKNYQYAVISGSKYKDANSKMLGYTKKIYNDNAKLQIKLKKDLKSGRAMKGMQYWSTISCKKKYSSSSKVSILCVNDTYEGGAHGMQTVKTFNIYKGKVIGLKSAFSSEKSYVDGKNYAKNYMLNHPSDYPFADYQTTIAGHSFFWTTKGLKVVFNPYEVNSFAAGIQYVSVPSKYLK